MSGSRVRRFAREGGYSLAALVAMMAVMAIVVAVALPSWTYVMQDDREQELIFRGRQISDAIARFQRRNGNAFPPSIEALVEGKYLRRPFKDPMTKAGRWRVLRPGEAGAPAPPGVPGGPRPGASPSPTPLPPSGVGPGSSPLGSLGPVAGVASTSTATSIRSINGSTRYNQWVFAPNVPLTIGTQPAGPAGPAGPNQGPPRRDLRYPDSETPRFVR